MKGIFLIERDREEEEEEEEEEREKYGPNRK